MSLNLDFDDNMTAPLMEIGESANSDRVGSMKFLDNYNEVSWSLGLKSFRVKGKKVETSSEYALIDTSHAFIHVSESDH
jgi:hypothetical protein